MRRCVYALLCIGLGMLLPSMSKAQLTSNFTSNIISGCSPILVQFTDQSTGGATSWTWDLGNGTISTLQNPSTTYITPGTYNVTLTVSDGANSDTKTSTAYITVIPTPVVSFAANDSGFLCPPETIQFINTSSLGVSGAASYLWDFGDGTTSNLSNPLHTYSNGGSFNVTLSVTNSTGCSKILTKPNYIQGILKPDADFTATNNNSCSTPLSVSFLNTTSGTTVSYLWDFGDGNTSSAISPTHIYGTPGSYTVTLIANNIGGCADTMIKPAFVNIGNLAADFTKSASVTCTNNNVIFTNTSVPSPGSSTWYFGDGSSSNSINANHVYTTPGTYTVKLVANYNNCSDSITQTITVNQGAAASFSANPTVGCTTPFTTQFTNNTSGAVSYVWMFGDGGTSTATSPSHTYTAQGVYTVKLVAISSNGCTDTLVRTDYIDISPATMGLNPSNFVGCTPATVNFVTSPNSSIPVSSYTWTFGDGTVVNGGASMSHTYTTPGTYSVYVNFTTGSGCDFLSNTSTVTIGTKPTAGFTANPTVICPNGTVNFTNTTTGLPGTTYTWDFGDGSSSTAQDPSHIYGGAGVFTVTLIATNNGCSDTLVMPDMITVNLPAADFQIAVNCINRKEVTFTDISVGADSWYWDFGDGTTSTQQNPVHVYAAFMPVTVTLTVTNAATGCTSTKDYSFTLYDLDPQFAVNDSIICKGETVNFTAIPNPNIDNYFWDFGDGSSVQMTTNTVTHTYTASGNFTVTLIEKDPRGCSDTLIKTTYILVGGPSAAFDGVPTNGCAPLLVNFTDQSSSPIAIADKIWRFGDGTLSNSMTAGVAHIYGTGVFTATLVLTDANGCVDSLVKTNYISATRPAASFYTNDTTICPGLPVQFVDNSAGNNLTYDWSFGDGTTATTASPSHAYALSGVYTVTLVVTDATSCKDTLIRTAYIHVGGINIGFTASDTFATCPPLTVNFTNNSVNASAYTWTFGNGNTSTLASPTTIFTLPGVYNVKLKGINSGGCIDSVTKTITVLGPSGTFSYSPTIGCAPLTVLFTSVNANTQLLIWDMDNGVTINTTTSPATYTYTQSGAYLPKLLLSDGVSCIVPIFGTDTIKVDKVDADFTFTSGALCQSGTAQFYDTVLYSFNPVTTRSWSFGDGGTSTQHNPTHFYASPGTYNITLIVGTSQGCTDTIIKQITILPLPNITAGPDQILCQGQTTSVQLQAGGGNTYSWSPATTLSCNNCSNPVATPLFTTTYIVTGTDANGCVDTAHVTVSIAPPPVVTAGADQTICSGGFASLQAGGAINYTWSPATNLSCINCANPSANPSNNTVYSVTGTDINGCTGTDDVLITVNQAPTVSAGPNQIICIGSSTTLQATGAASYTWSPATGLSCTNCANPTATPATTTTYTVTGIGSASNICSNTATVTITVALPPTINAGANQTVCAGGNTQLQASGGVSYSWTPSAGLSCTTCANPVASPAATTTYTVTGVDANGCNNTSQITVTVNPLPTISAGTNQNICAGGTVPLQATGGVTYTWSPAVGLSCTNCANPIASPATTTTYTVTGVNANGCSNTSQITVTVNPLPAVNAGSNPSICLGGTTTLQATGAVNYTWSPATGLSCTNCANPTANPVSTTTYTVTGTNANGCSNTSQVTVIVNPLPTISGGSFQSACIGGSVSLQATGGISYNWSPATGLSCTNCANPTASPTATTTYIVTGTNANGCTNTSQVTVTINPLPVITTGANPTICNGASVQLGVTGANTYTWSPATGLSCTNCANPFASPATTTTYTVTGTSAAGCVNTGQVTVAVVSNPNVSASAINPVICAGGTSQLHASGGNNYTWTPATGLSCTNCTNPVATPSTTTTYMVTGTSGSCTDTGVVTIVVNPLPAVNAGANQAICTGASTTLQASGASGYTWSPAIGLSCTNCANPTVNINATTTYTVTGTNANGCANTSSVTVTVNPLPAITASNNQTTCLGIPVPLSVSGAANYTWTPASGLSCNNCPNPNANPGATTTYTVIGTDGNGCKDTAQVTVNVNPLPNVDAGPNKAICKLDTTQLQASGALTYVWTPAANLSCTNCSNPFANPTTTTTYTVTGTDANGCSKSDNVIVSINPQPVINAGPDQTICRGQTLQLQAGGGQTYRWSPGTYLSCTACPDPLSNPAADITYTVIGTDANGCNDSDKINITVIQMQPFIIGPGDTLCEGESTQLFASGGDQYLWTPALGLSNEAVNNPTATPSGTTTYQVIIRQGFCFSDTGNITIVVNPKPTVNAGTDQSILAGSTANLFADATHTTQYLWSPITDLSCNDCNSPVASPKKTTTYTVFVSNQYGCKAQDDVTIFVNCDNSLIFMANTFTPNGDGNNDRFYPQAKGIATIKRFRVYNRWGELIYDVQNMPANTESGGWDGTYKGEALKPDVFVYILDAVCDTGEPMQLKGDISLIR